MSRKDLYIFAGSHFYIAEKYGTKLKDIILYSGKPYKGKKEIETQSGKYKPDMIDLTSRDEIKLVHQKLMSKKLAAATMIMSNKMISKNLLSKYWEKLQMYDVFEIAVEKGMEKGMEKARREMLLEALSETIGFVPPSIIDSVNKISRTDVLSGLFKQAIKCQNVDQFQKSLQMAM
ncbi:hypothetical protein MHK_007097 [Candidatus Magnetomorum sp. HK-1]|nr:hypothetical protein MHK_007097 [Candidatus Magnetomorum sp. HK-1]